MFLTPNSHHLYPFYQPKPSKSLFKLLPLLVATLCASSYSYAIGEDAINLDDYVKSDTGCYIYKPMQSFGSVVKWHGDCVDGFAQGEGSANWYDKDNQLASRYQGHFNHGKLEGSGKIDWESVIDCEMDYYVGELKNSYPTYGTMHFTDGNIYIGRFAQKQGEPVQAVFIWGENSPYKGDRYEGTFVNGKMDVYGVYTWGPKSYWAGDKYEGEYKNGQREGFGIYTTSDGERYEGNWKNSIKSGHGKLTYSNGDVYDGEFANNQLHGQGKLVQANGDIYEGEFYYGNLHGDVVIHTANGHIFDVIYEHGDIVEGSQIRPNGIKYDGSWRDGKAWGFGTLTAPKAAFDADRRAKNGVWIGNIFVEKGWFFDNKFKFPCDSTEHCIEVAKKDPELQQYMLMY